MKPPSPALLSLARRLLDFESGANPDAARLATGAEAVLRKLSDRLEPVIGPTGFAVTLARALYVARAESPLLESVNRDASSGSHLEGLTELARERGAAELREAVSTLIAVLLELCAYFMGEDLTMRIVTRAWPDIPAQEAGSASDEEAE